MKRILILDDERSITFSLSRCLQSDSVQVISCQDSLSAMRSLAETRFDAIIADVRLSVINPYEAIQFIQHVRSVHQEILLIMMSGTEELKAETLRAGATYFFQKPLDVDRLIQLLRALGIEAGQERQEENYSKSNPNRYFGNAYGFS
jgi:Response regulator containing CheY-like receiver, AAA-type ATPase, and DNA-binding domains